MTVQGAPVVELHTPSAPSRIQKTNLHLISAGPVLLDTVCDWFLAHDAIIQ